MSAVGSELESSFDSTILFSQCGFFYKSNQIKVEVLHVAIENYSFFFVKEKIKKENN